MKITIQTGVKSIEVEATATKMEGLAWHKAACAKGYTITHIASGYSVVRGIPTKDRLAWALRELEKLGIDWTLGRDELRVANGDGSIRRIATTAIYDALPKTP